MAALLINKHIRSVLSENVTVTSALSCFCTAVDGFVLIDILSSSPHYDHPNDVILTQLLL